MTEQIPMSAKRQKQWEAIMALGMAEQSEHKLREQIAIIIREETDEEHHQYYLKLADQILALIEAYYKEKGYVKLAKDQNLPPNKMVCNMRVIGEPTITEQVQAEIRREIEIWVEAQQDMLKAGWRKVELEVKDGGKRTLY